MEFKDRERAQEHRDRADEEAKMWGMAKDLLTLITKCAKDGNIVISPEDLKQVGALYEPDPANPQDAEVDRLEPLQRVIGRIYVFETRAKARANYNDDILRSIAAREQRKPK